MKKHCKVCASVTMGAIIALLSGCATITNKTTQKVAITTSNGESVMARIGDQKIQIPAEVAISRKNGATVEIKEEDNKCYKDTKLVIAGKSEVSGVFWINIISGGFFGSTTDAVSGGMWHYSNPNFVVPVNKKEKCKA